MLDQSGNNGGQGEQYMSAQPQSTNNSYLTNQYSISTSQSSAQQNPNIITPPPPPSTIAFNPSTITSSSTTLHNQFVPQY